MLQCGLEIEAKVDKDYQQNQARYQDPGEVYGWGFNNSPDHTDGNRDGQVPAGGAQVPEIEGQVFAAFVAQPTIPGTVRGHLVGRFNAKSYFDFLYQLVCESLDTVDQQAEQVDASQFQQESNQTPTGAQGPTIPGETEK